MEDWKAETNVPDAHLRTRMVRDKPSSVGFVEASSGRVSARMCGASWAGVVGPTK